MERDPQSPPPRLPHGLTDQQRRWLDQRMSWLLTEFGPEWIQNAEVARPTDPFAQPAWNKSEFAVSPESRELERMESIIARVNDAFALNEELVDWQIVEAAQEASREVDETTSDTGTGERFVIWASVSGLHDPVGMITSLSRCAARIRLSLQSPEVENLPDFELLVDLFMINSGLGIFLSDAALRERHWNALSHQGASLERLGFLTLPMYGYALAFFAVLQQEANADWKSHLRAELQVIFEDSVSLLQQHGPSETPLSFDHSFFAQFAASLLAEEHEDPDSRLSALAEQSSTSSLNRLCIFCGDQMFGMPEGTLNRRDDEAIAEENEDDDVCQACQDSIEENQRALADDAPKVQQSLGDPTIYAICFAVVVLIMLLESCIS